MHREVATPERSRACWLSVLALRPYIRPLFASEGPVHHFGCQRLWPISDWVTSPASVRRNLEPSTSNPSLVSPDIYVVGTRSVAPLCLGGGGSSVPPAACPPLLNSIQRLSLWPARRTSGLASRLWRAHVQVTPVGCQRGNTRTILHIAPLPHGTQSGTCLRRTRALSAAELLSARSVLRAAAAHAPVHSCAAWQGRSHPGRGCKRGRACRVIAEHRMQRMCERLVRSAGACHVMPQPSCRACLTCFPSAGTAARSRPASALNGWGALISCAALAQVTVPHICRGAQPAQLRTAAALLAPAVSVLALRPGASESASGSLSERRAAAPGAIAHLTPTRSRTRASEHACRHHLP